MDCHGAGGDWSFNSLIPDALDPRCEFVVQHALDRVHRDARAGLRRRAVRRPARPRGRRARRALAHGQLDQVAQPALQRHARRRGRHQRRAVRHLGHAGRARHRRRRRLRRVHELLGPGLRRSRSSAASGRFSARHLSPATARELLEAAARDALADIAERPGLRPRGALHDRSGARDVRRRRRLPAPGRRRRSPTRARSRSRRPPGGTPGARSTSSSQNGTRVRHHRVVLADQRDGHVAARRTRRSGACPARGPGWSAGTSRRPCSP